MRGRRPALPEDGRSIIICYCVRAWTGGDTAAPNTQLASIRVGLVVNAHATRIPIQVDLDLKSTVIPRLPQYSFSSKAGKLFHVNVNDAGG